MPGTGRTIRSALAVALAAALGVPACQDTPPRPATSLADHVHVITRLADAERAEAVAAWQMDRATWEATVVEPYRALYDDHARAFAAMRPALVDQLARPGTITTRAHYAGDPRLTRAQARARWALPVLYPSEVAELAGAPVDAVFVRHGARWFAIAGLDRVIRTRVEAMSPACADHLDVVRPGRCADVSWVIADAALRTDRARFDHACALAASLCVVHGSP